ncbi:MAG TPA: hypothetical protein VF604_16825 [Pyrinomonadaceae bacterium]|jgi:hypothetical protein
MGKDEFEVKISFSNLKKSLKKDTKWYLLAVSMFGFAVYAYWLPIESDGHSSDKPAKPVIKNPKIYKVGNVVGYQVNIVASKKYEVKVTDNTCHYIILQRQNREDIILRFDGKTKQAKQVDLEKGVYMFTLFPTGSKTATASFDIQPIE